MAKKNFTGGGYPGSDAPKTSTGPESTSSEHLLNVDTSSAEVSLLSLAKLARPLSDLFDSKHSFNVDTSKAASALTDLERGINGVLRTAGKASATIAGEIDAAFANALDISTSTTSAMKSLTGVATKIKEMQKGGQLFDEKDVKSAQLIEKYLYQAASVVFERPIHELNQAIDEAQDAIAKGGVGVPPAVLKSLNELKEVREGLLLDAARASDDIQEAFEKGEDVAKKMVEIGEKLEEKKKKTQKGEGDLIAQSIKAAKAVRVESEKASQAYEDAMDLIGKGVEDKLRSTTEGLLRGVNDKIAAREVGLGGKTGGTGLSRWLGAKAARGAARLQGGANAINTPIISGPMSNLAKGIGSLTSAAGMLTATLGAAALALKFFLDSDALIKELNKTIAESSAGVSNIYASRISRERDIRTGVDEAFEDVRNHFKNWFNAMRMSQEEMAKTAFSMGQSGDKISDIAIGFKGDYKEIAYTVATYAKLTGKSTDEIGAFASGIHDSFVLPFQDVDNVMSILTDDLYASALGADRFFNSIKQVAFQNRLFNAGLVSTSKMLSMLGSSTQLASDDVVDIFTALGTAMSKATKEQIGAMQYYGADFAGGFKKDLKVVGEDIEKTLARIQLLDPDVAKTLRKAGGDPNALSQDQIKNMGGRAGQLVDQLTDQVRIRSQLKQGASGDLVTQLNQTKFLRPVTQAMETLKVIVGKNKDAAIGSAVSNISGTRMDVLGSMNIDENLVRQTQKLFSGIEKDLIKAGFYDKDKDGALTFNKLEELMNGESAQARGVQAILEAEARVQEHRKKAEAIAAQTQPITDAIKLAVENLLIRIGDGIHDIYQLLRKLPGLSGGKPSAAMARGELDRAGELYAGKNTQAQEDIYALQKEQGLPGTSAGRQNEIDGEIEAKKKYMTENNAIMVKLNEELSNQLQSEEGISEEWFSALKDRTKAVKEAPTTLAGGAAVEASVEYGEAKRAVVEAGRARGTITVDPSGGLKRVSDTDDAQSAARKVEREAARKAAETMAAATSQATAAQESVVDKLWDQNASQLEIAEATFKLRELKAAELKAGALEPPLGKSERMRDLATFMTKNPAADSSSVISGALKPHLGKLEKIRDLDTSIAKNQANLETYKDNPAAVKVQSELLAKALAERSELSGSLMGDAGLAAILNTAPTNENVESQVNLNGTTYNFYGLDHGEVEAAILTAQGQQVEVLVKALDLSG